MLSKLAEGMPSQIDALLAVPGLYQRLVEIVQRHERGTTVEAGWVMINSIARGEEVRSCTMCLFFLIAIGS